MTTGGDGDGEGGAGSLPFPIQIGNERGMGEASDWE